MKELRTEIKIKATPEKIWRILTDFKRYPEWNSFIPKIEGNVAEGQKLKVKLVPPNANGMTIKPVITRVLPNRQLYWKGHLLFPGLFDGEHMFEINEHADGTCTFIHRENFGGILIPLFKKMLDVNTRQGFEMMNAELRKRCEDL